MAGSDRTTAFIAMGANLGDRAGNIAAAMNRLRAEPNVEVVAVSQLMDNPAVGGPPASPPFLNGAAQLQTTLAARELLDLLLSVEHALGRQRRQRWEPRPIDLDLLLFGQEIIDEPGLSVPHPLMHLRSFVLEPLAQIAPAVVHPRLGLTIEELLQRLRTENPAR